MSNIIIPERHKATFDGYSDKVAQATESAAPADMSEIERDINPTLYALRLDARRTTFIGRKHELLIFLTDRPIAGRNTPCLLLANRNNPSKQNLIFPLKDLWLILEKTAPEMVMQMAEVLFLVPTRQDSYKIMDALFDYADDLKSAKPPRWISNQQWLECMAADGLIFHRDGVAING